MIRQFFGYKIVRKTAPSCSMRLAGQLRFNRSDQNPFLASAAANTDRHPSNARTIPDTGDCRDMPRYSSQIMINTLARGPATFDSKAIAFSPGSGRKAVCMCCGYMLCVHFAYYPGEHAGPAAARKCSTTQPPLLSAGLFHFCEAVNQVTRVRSILHWCFLIRKNPCEAPRQ